MATKKQKRAIALKKHEEFMAAQKWGGLEAQRKAHERQEFRRKAAEADKEAKSILDTPKINKEN